MPPIRVPARPYVRNPYASDTRAIGSIYARQGDILAEGARQKGAISTQFMAGLAAAWNQLQAEEAAKQQQAIELAREDAQIQRAEAIRNADLERAAQREQGQIEREAAVYAAENTAPGALDARRAEIIRKFPGTAARLRMTETLPATVTLGAMGAVDQQPSQFDVLEPTPQQTRQAQLDAAAREREAQAVKDREEDNRRQAERDAEIRRHNQALERAANTRTREPERPSVWLKKGDQTRFVTPSEAAQLSQQGWQQPSGAQRPASGLEKRALNFFNRAQQADKDIEDLETAVQGMNLGQQTYMEWAPNFAQTTLGQKYTQAQRAFTEARLRKDSGAAIPKEEFQNDRETYFAQPGDDPETLEQKRRGRAAVLASLGFESGQALGEFMGDLEQAQALVQEYRARSQKKEGGGMTVRMIAPDGTEKDVSPDQVEHYKSLGAKVKS